MSHYRGYQGAGRCTGTVTPGARALMAWHLGAYGGLGATNLGIYNCATIPGSTAWSLHGEGRASDLGVPVGAPWAQPEADFLVAYSAELGVQCVIYNERIWSGSYPNAGWRRYNGVQRHHEHIHAELSWAAAGALTVARINEVAAGHIGPPLERDWTRELITMLPTLKRGAKGNRVRQLQASLVYVYGIDVGPTGADGDFGPATEQATRVFQARVSIAVDGQVGHDTWWSLLTA